LDSLKAGTLLIYLIPNFILVIITHNDYFIKDLLKIWSKESKLFRYDLLKPETNFFKRGIRTLKNLILINRILRETDYKLVFFEWGSSLFGLISRLLQIKTPVIVRLHRYEIYEKHLYRVDFHKIDKIILVSDFMRDEFLKKFPNLEPKTTVIPNTIKFDAYYPPKTKKITHNICTLSHLIDLKRIDLVIDTMKRIKNPKVKLYIGGDGPLLGQLKKKIKKDNLEHKVFLDGRITKVREWFEDKDIIINASEIESFALTLVEAMACKVIPFIRGWNAAKNLYPKDFILSYNEYQFIDSLSQHIDEFYTLSENQQITQRNFVRELIKSRYTIAQQIKYFDKIFTSLLKRLEMPISKKDSILRSISSIFHYIVMSLYDLVSPLLNRRKTNNK